MTRILVLAVVFVLVLTTVAAAHPLETVPPTHWAYGALRQLAVLGLIPFRTLAHLPLTRGEIAALVRTAEQSAGARALPVGARDVLSALVQAFPPADQAVRPQVTLRGAAGPASSVTTYPGLAPGSFAGVGAGAGGNTGILWFEGGVSTARVQVTRA